MQIDEENDHVEVDPGEDDIFGNGISGINNLSYKRIFRSLSWKGSSKKGPTHHGIMTIQHCISACLDFYAGSIYGFQDSIIADIPFNLVQNAFEGLDKTNLQHLYYAAKYFPFVARSQFWNRFILKNEFYAGTPFLGKCGASIYDYSNFFKVVNKFKLNAYLFDWQMDSNLALYLNAVGTDATEDPFLKIINAYYYEYFCRVQSPLPKDRVPELWKDNVFIDGKIVRASPDRFVYKYKDRLRTLDLEFFKELDEAKDTYLTSDFVHIFTYFDKTPLTQKEITMEDCCAVLGIRPVFGC